MVKVGSKQHCRRGKTTPTTSCPHAQAGKQWSSHMLREATQKGNTHIKSPAITPAALDPFAHANQNSWHRSTQHTSTQAHKHMPQGTASKPHVSPRTTYCACASSLPWLALLHLPVRLPLLQQRPLGSREHSGPCWSLSTPPAPFPCKQKTS